MESWLRDLGDMQYQMFDDHSAFTNSRGVLFFLSLLYVLTCLFLHIEDNVKFKLGGEDCELQRILKKIEKLKMLSKMETFWLKPLHELSKYLEELAWVLSEWMILGISGMNQEWLDLYGMIWLDDWDGHYKGTWTLIGTSELIYMNCYSYLA